MRRRRLTRGVRRRIRRAIVRSRRRRRGLRLSRVARMSRGGIRL